MPSITVIVSDITVTRSLPSLTPSRLPALVPFAETIFRQQAYIGIHFLGTDRILGYVKTGKLQHLSEEEKGAVFEDEVSQRVMLMEV